MIDQLAAALHRLVKGELVRKKDILPTVADAPSAPTTPKPTPPKPRPTPARRPPSRTTLIPKVEYGVAWTGRLQRHRAIWEELQFKLDLLDHPNAVSVLFRVLLELAIDNHISQTGLATVHPNDKLANKLLKVAEHLHQIGKIDQKYLGVCKKAQNLDLLVSTDTLNWCVHSPQFAPSPEHLKALWDNLADLIVACLNF